MSSSRPGYAGSSDRGNERCARGGTRKFCRWVVVEDRVEAPAAASRLEDEARPAGQDSVHREPRAPEVVARRIEDEEVEAGGGSSKNASRARIGRPEERVVEGVEVRALGNRGPLRISRSVGADDVAVEAGGGLHRARMPDSACGARSRGATCSSVCASRTPWATVCVSRGTSRPGRKVVSTRSWKSKTWYHAARSSNRCERCRCVPWTK